MKTYTRKTSNSTLAKLRKSIGRIMKAYRIWSPGGNKCETFESMQLIFSDNAVSISCSSDISDDSSTAQGIEADIATFTASSCSIDDQTGPFDNTPPLEIQVNERITDIQILNEHIVIHDLKSGEASILEHTRGFIFILESKQLMFLKKYSWGDTLDVIETDKKLKINPSREWVNNSDEEYKVTSTLTSIL